MTFSKFQAYFRAIERDEIYRNRLAFQGGSAFINDYCYRFSNREKQKDYQFRKKVTYNPAFASAAVLEVRNSIYKRTKDITRIGGPANYKTACTGAEGGIDLLGASMSTFMCNKVLEEMLVAREVGIYVDKPPISPEETAADTRNKRPYCYTYLAEDIVYYERDEGSNIDEFKVVMVREKYPVTGGDLGLVCGEKESYKLFKKVDDHVEVTEIDIFEADPENHIEEKMAVPREPIILKIKSIPFHIAQLPKSLMSDIAAAQIALLNLSSADMWYTLRANFPFYVEPYEPKSEAARIKRPENTTEPQEDSNSISVSPTTGRRYPASVGPPSFIAPPTEPLLASMKKQDQIKAEIREMVHLSLTSLASSADSKSSDKEKLEDGLAYIGTILQIAENRIAKFWSMYENSDVATVKYPECYHLVDETDSRENAKLDIEVASKTTSHTLKKELVKKIARTRVGPVTDAITLKKIESEIDGSDVVLADWQEIAKDIENGLVGNELASQARGYPKGETDQAKVDHAERLARIQAAQTPPGAPAGTNPEARGLKDQSADPAGGQKEKAASRDTTKDVIPTDKTRGNAVG